MKTSNSLLNCKFFEISAIEVLTNALSWRINLPTNFRGVAQPGSAPGLGPGGRRFESSLPDHFVIAALPGAAFYFLAHSFISCNLIG